MTDYSKLSSEELDGKLKTATNVRVAVLVIFGGILLTWIVLGYWRTNTPVFVSTIALGITTLLTTSIAPRKLQEEIQKRTGDEQTG